jgi:allantoicase
VDLASERVGGVVLAANDDFFAPKENLLKPEPPVFIEGKYTDRGKWMDGWETRRRRTPGHDSCIIRLGLPGVIRGIVVDTSFFKGNYPESCSLEACAFEGEDESTLAADETGWTEILPPSPLAGDTQNRFDIRARERFTHLRFHIYPDGGVARLRVYGEALPDWRNLLGAGTEFDLASVAHGGQIMDSSDRFFSEPLNLLMPGRGVNMGDGWETRRRRGPGFDWVLVKLGIAGEIRRVLVDTAHFKGNYPESCSLEACDALDPKAPDVAWFEVVPRSVLQADSMHEFTLTSPAQARFIRLNIFPDGGVSRLRVFGAPTAAGRREHALRWLNTRTPDKLRAALRDCCGATRWVETMLEGLPFGHTEELLQAADAAFARLQKDDWLEAFRAHPRIGETPAAAPRSRQAAHWSGSEQAGMAAAPAATAAAMADANHQYQERFGYIFIICATGRSAGEMLAAAQARLKNPPEAELPIAAAEQRKITHLRLERLLAI